MLYSQLSFQESLTTPVCSIAFYVRELDQCDICCNCIIHNLLVRNTGEFLMYNGSVLYTVIKKNKKSVIDKLLELIFFLILNLCICKNIFQ